MPLAYYYGFPSPKDNSKLYSLLLARLAQSVNRRLEEDEAGAFLFFSSREMDHVQKAVKYTVINTVYLVLISTHIWNRY